MMPRDKSAKPIRRGAPHSPRQQNLTLGICVRLHVKAYPAVIVDVGVLRVDGFVMWLSTGVEGGEVTGAPGIPTVDTTFVAVELEHHSAAIGNWDAEIVRVGETK